MMNFVAGYLVDCDDGRIKVMMHQQYLQLVLDVQLGEVGMRRVVVYNQNMWSIQGLGWTERRNVDGAT